jgi:GDPmannose 4,6-dehydratase
VKILITGITGQDGSYLAELLLSQGHDVFGVRRRSSSFNTGRIDHIYKDSHLNEKGLRLVHGDMSDASSLHRVISQIEPDRIYNLAAQSHVGVSFDEPEYTADTVALGTLRLLEVIRSLGGEDSIRLYQASTSELFGGQQKELLTELSLFDPRSPYAAAKMYAHTLTKNYRDAFNIFCSTGILFNHESPRRGQTFVTRKITMGIARILQGSEMPIYLGNLDAVRDWGHAKDYVEAMSLIIEADKADDYVVATGVGHTVREFLFLACEVAGLNVESRGIGNTEVIINKKNNKTIAMVDPRYFRPLEVDQLIGDASKISKALGWHPRISFEELVVEMVENDIELSIK